MYRPRERNTSWRRPQSRRPSIESLESRTLLAGNVITTPTGTPDSPGQPTPTLEIIGDDEPNQVMVRRGSRPDEIVVNGLNGTLVNGSTQEWHFQGVEQITVLLNGGDDTFDGRNLTLSAEPGAVGTEFEGVTTAILQVDGGAGDDRLTLFSTRINAVGLATPPSPEDLIIPVSSAGVVLLGEASGFGPTSGTGNDFIEVSNTTIIADGGGISGASLEIYGEQNLGGTITGGNDRINVSNTVIRATSTSIGGSATALVIIHGDDNIANPDIAATSVIGEGNDWIDVNATSIIAESTEGVGAAFVQILGDFNSASGTGSATIGDFASKAGGDDTINLTNTTVSASGDFSSNFVFVDIQGEQNLTGDATATATVGSGNDTITVDNFDVTASGVMSSQSANLGIFGDGSYAGANLGRIGRGNDTIYVQNVEVSGTGTLSDSATLTLFSDDQTGVPETDPGGTTVGEGTDNVQLSSFLLHAGAIANVQMNTRKGNDVIDVLNIQTSGLGILTGTGDDDLDILNSNWVDGNVGMEDGNDLLKMNGNFFVKTDADGGLGFDTLNAHSNSGLLVFVNFEDVNIS